MSRISNRNDNDDSTKIEQIIKVKRKFNFPLKNINQLVANESITISNDKNSPNRNEGTSIIIVQSDEVNFKQEENSIAKNKNDNEKRGNDNGNIPSQTRKRIRRPETWERNIIKRRREAGQEYVSPNGKVRQAKHVKPGCENTCNYKCTTKFSPNHRQAIIKEFYKLSDAQKNKYYKDYTEKIQKSRKRTAKTESRREYTFIYYLPKEQQRERVCKKFFCNTLDISVRRIYYFHKMLDKKSLASALTPARGKHVKKQTDCNKIQEVMNHISSFPKQESHLCRSNSKQYLDSGLSIAKMYALYVEKHEDPVKENIYRKVFNEKFNLGFQRSNKIHVIYVQNLM